MTRYIIKRILMTLLIVFVATFIVFVLLHWIPQFDDLMRFSPFFTIEGDGDALDYIFAFFNASDNIFTRYLRYVYNAIFHFDFGVTWYMAPLVYELAERTRNTLIILSAGTALTLITGIPLGIYAAVRKNRLGDRIANILTLILSSVPIFAMAFVILVFFVLHLGVLPAAWRYLTPSVFIMPTITVALGAIASIARITRASMIEVLEKPYINALRARGLKESQVIYRHALRNALIPVVASLGGFISQLIIGLFVVENFFTIHGLSSLLLQALDALRPLHLLGSVVFMTVILAVANLASDISYAIINPKIRLRYSGRSRKLRGAK